MLAASGSRRRPPGPSSSAPPRPSSAPAGRRCPFCGSPLDPDGPPVRARQRLPAPVTPLRPTAVTSATAPTLAGELDARRPDHAGLQRDVRRRDRRASRVRLQAGRGRAAAVGLPGRHPGRRARSRRTPSPRRSGWDVVPPTVLRDGPHGPGMVQLWSEPDDAVAGASTSCPAAQVPDGLAPRLRRRRRRRTSRSRSSTRTRRRCAGWRCFDVVVNNADRKGGHVLPMPRRAPVTASTTASTFHVEHKLRTVLWGWAGEPLHRRRTAGAASGCATALDGRRSASDAARAAHRRRGRRAARRCARLLRRGRCPSPPRRWPGDPVAAVLSRPAPDVGSAPCVPGLRLPVPSLDRPRRRTRCRRRAARHRDRLEVVDRPARRPARLYVCGITPYDATHIGHAATYVAFDLLNRAWRDAGPRGALRPERDRRRRPAAGAGRR